jgi:hypothetical protein
MNIRANENDNSRRKFMRNDVDCTEVYIEAEKSQWLEMLIGRLASYVVGGSLWLVTEWTEVG